MERHKRASGPQHDIRGPLGQGRELYNALKSQGVPVEMVIYPRQRHGIAEPRLWLDVRRRVIAWFERWLLNGGEVALAEEG